MKTRNTIMAAIALCFGLSCSAQPCPGKAIPAVSGQKPNYTITFTPSSGPLSLKSPLVVDMYYTNIASSCIYMQVAICRTCVSEFVILTKDGKEVETTPFHRVSTRRALPGDTKQYPGQEIAFSTDRYPPGVFWKVNLDLRKLYKITEPGRYTLTASRKDRSQDGEITVNSNTITFDIVP
jgi:hypothetical protein